MNFFGEKHIYTLKSYEYIPGIDILKKIGRVKTSKGEYSEFTFNKQTYPIEQVMIRRVPAGYAIFIKKEIKNDVL